MTEQERLERRVRFSEAIGLKWYFSASTNQYCMFRPMNVEPGNTFWVPCEKQGLANIEGRFLQGYLPDFDNSAEARESLLVWISEDWFRTVEMGTTADGDRFCKVYDHLNVRCWSGTGNYAEAFLSAVDAAIRSRDEGTR